MYTESSKKSRNYGKINTMNTISHPVNYTQRQNTKQLSTIKKNPELLKTMTTSKKSGLNNEKSMTKYYVDLTALNPFKQKNNMLTQNFSSSIFEESAARVYSQNENLRSPSFNQGNSFNLTSPEENFSQSKFTDISSSIMSKFQQKQQNNASRHASQQRMQPSLNNRRNSRTRYDNSEEKLISSKSAMDIYNIQPNYNEINEDSFSAKTETPLKPQKIDTLLRTIEELSGQVKGMKRTMDHMQISISERETQIAELKMSLGDERQKVFFVNKKKI